jgi:hypothetical protein
MTGYEAYLKYLALKLHFSEDGKFDYFKYNGKVLAPQKTYEKRSDKDWFEKLARKYSDDAVVSFLLSNIIALNKPAWVGDLMQDSEAETIFSSWKKRLESISYTFSNDISYLILQLEIQHLPFNSLFKIIDKKYPMILKFFYRKEISLETIILMNKILGFLSRFNKVFKGDIVWEDFYLLVKKYEPFLVKLDVNNLKAILREKFLEHNFYHTHRDFT